MGDSRQSRSDRLRRLALSPFSAVTVRYGRRYLNAYPEDGLAWLRVGIALVELARYEEAEQAYGKAIEFCPPERRDVPWVQLGHLFQQAGEYDQAAEWYARAVEFNPSDASNHIYLGSVRALQGRFHEAEESHRAGTQCNTGCVDEAYFNLGLVLRAREQFAEAAACFREAIRIDPEYRAAKRALRDVELCLKLG